jgi:hypothetical protein
VQCYSECARLCDDKCDYVKDSFCEELGRVFNQFLRYDMNIS